MQDAKASATDVTNMAEFVRRAAQSGAQRPALHHADRVMTWGELDAAVDSVAAGLRGLGAPASDGQPARVAIALPNIPEFAIAFFAALRAGLVAVPVNPTFTAPELRHVLADSGASVLIATDGVAMTVSGVAAELTALKWSYTCSGEGASMLARGLARDATTAVPPPLAPAGGEDVAVLLYTSGTEGRPKGAILSHRALIANHLQLDAIEPPVLSADDVVLLALPLFHAYGLNSGLGAIAYYGAAGVMHERFDADETLALIERHGVSVVVGVPPMYVGWTQSDAAARALRTVRLAVCGAAPLDPAAAKRFTAITGHQVFVGYGLTETAPVVASTVASPVAKVGSIGRPLPGIEVRLVGVTGDIVWESDGAEQDEHASDTLETEAPDSPGTDPGEIVTRGANLFSGYWPDGRGGPDADGWWATGDVAYADGDGDLFLVDRIGELILVNGFNVYPHEVELVLAAHPGVAEAAVLGAPHERTGQTPQAYIVRAPGTPVTEADLVKHCERNLARFKWPTRYSFVAELPHSATGKVRKVVLRDERA
ncbi:long-chain acyl-CoA synthetase [Allocatelliglobosispora scoriae]|uniref:Long-chain acyl-CoA synthetase n=1 Tax=Allocatelliglobosispora scoriae TaxID=643052 RepID=A0A841BVI7_9ACTN|nr:AMP-binding protein [Allocatelliglobosispora scoriae]MBB5871468.1 long-chain acyl-CoA synthetase [Allocatelliglobosispora scoriae]